MATADYEKTAQQLSAALGHEVDVVTLDDTSIKTLVLDLNTDGNIADITSKKVQALNDKIRQTLTSSDGGWTLNSDVVYIGMDKKLHFGDDPVELQEYKLSPEGEPHPTGATKEVGLMDFLKPYLPDVTDIINHAPDDIKKEVTENAEREKKEKEMEAAYAKQTTSFAGIDVTVESRALPDKQKCLIIKIGNGAAAEKAVDEIVKLRDNKTGLTKKDLAFSFDANGDIVIPVKNILAYEAFNGSGSLVKKLEDAGVVGDFAHIIKEAKDEADKIKKMPTFKRESSSFDYPGINNSKYKDFIIQGADFDTLPDSIKQAALLAAKDLRSQLDERNIKDPAATRELYEAAGLDGKKGPVSDQELAALLLAKSLSSASFDALTGPHNSITPSSDIHFNDELDEANYTDQGGKDPDVVFQEAREILLKAYGVPIVENGVTVTKAELDQEFNDAVSKSLSTDRTR